MINKATTWLKLIVAILLFIYIRTVFAVIITDIAKIDAGLGHTCALTTSKTMKCWGRNSSGQLGDGTTIEQTSPVDVLGLSGDVVDIAVGGNHTCALLSSGNVECWGDGQYGQLGNGRYTIPKPNPLIVVTASGDLAGVSKITAGRNHTCALLNNGTTKCWGLNSDGQLGHGTTSEYHSIAVDVLNYTFTEITAGTYQSCGLLSSGTAKCWGDNTFWQLANSDYPDQSIPVDIVGLSAIKTISSGESHICAVTTSGAAKCWGYNGACELGDGRCGYGSAEIRDVVGLATGITDIYARYSNSCALTSSGSLKCWGENNNGQLGDGTTTRRDTPVDMAGLSGITAVAIGFRHICALTSIGTVKCLGGNGNGQLGDGTLIDRTSPVDVIETVHQQDYYSLTVDKIGSGTVTSTPIGISCGTDCMENYAAGTPVKLTAIAENGWKFKEWGANCSNGMKLPLPCDPLTDICNFDYPIEITMDEVKSCTATFILDTPGTYPLTINNSGNDQGTISIITQSSNEVLVCGPKSLCNNNVAANDTVDIEAVLPATGYEFAGWSGDCAFGGTNLKITLTMDKAKFCTTIFIPIPPETYQLTLNNSGNGQGSTVAQSSSELLVCGWPKSVCSDNFSDTVTVEALPATDYKFTGWSGDCAFGGTNLKITLTMDKAKSCTATFIPIPPETYQLTLNNSGNGQGSTVAQSSSELLVCGWPKSVCNDNFKANDTVTVEALPATGYEFAGWSGDCAFGGTNLKITLSMDGIKSCTATFSAGQSLNVLINGIGGVTSNPIGIDCNGTQTSSCLSAFNSGTNVTLTAIPTPETLFVTWDGDCAGTSLSFAIGMDGNKECTAKFSMPMQIDAVIPSVVKLIEGQTNITLTILGTGFVSNPSGDENTKLKVHIPGVVTALEGDGLTVVSDTELSVHVPQVHGKNSVFGVTTNERTITIRNGYAIETKTQDGLVYVADKLTIKQVDPSQLVEGQKNIALTIHGTGFLSNPAGTDDTKLKVHIPGVVTALEGNGVTVISDAELSVLVLEVYGENPELGLTASERSVTIRNGYGSNTETVDGLVYVDMHVSFTLGFPLVYKATKNSYFDHAMTGGFYGDDRNRTVMTYEGRTGVSYNGHTGYDYRTKYQPTERRSGQGDVDILAAASGVVIYASGGGTRGCNCNVTNCKKWGAISIQHTQEYMTCYLHLSNNSMVKIGDRVTKGQVIGIGGNVAPPGGSTGPHLHFQVNRNGTPVDPYGWQGGGADPYPFATNTWLWDFSPASDHITLATLSTTGETNATIVGNISSRTVATRRIQRNIVNNYLFTDHLDLVFTVMPDKDDLLPNTITEFPDEEMTLSSTTLSGNSAIYVVANYVDSSGNSLWVQKNGNAWNIWDGQLSTLIPWIDGIQLMPEEQVDVIQGLAGLPGDFNVYVGYRNAAGGITFNSEALEFTVQ